MRLKKKHCLTLAEHRELGMKLYEQRHELLRTANQMSRAYGIRSRASRTAHNSLWELDKFRSAMDSQLAHDYLDDFCPHVYYPGSTDEQESHKKSGCETCYPVSE